MGHSGTVGVAEEENLEVGLAASLDMTEGRILEVSSNRNLDLGLEAHESGDENVIVDPKAELGHTSLTGRDFLNENSELEKDGNVDMDVNATNDADVHKDPRESGRDQQAGLRTSGKVGMDMATNSEIRHKEGIYGLLEGDGNDTLEPTKEMGSHGTSMEIPTDTIMNKETGSTVGPEPDKGGKHVSGSEMIDDDATGRSVTVTPEESKSLLDECLLDRMDNEGEGGELCALWVKWRGKWQAGIQCNMEDYPAATVNSMPSYDGKAYIVVYFPSSHSYVWVDGQLVCPITEAPEPVAFGSHQRGRESVSDLDASKNYMLQRLAAAMLDISDCLPLKAVVESARGVSVWKEFAKEAAQAVKYSELGVMLVKLHGMILSTCLREVWVKNRFVEWKQQCDSTKTAATLEKLIKELRNAVSWDKVGKMWDKSEQKNLGSEWMSWKNDVDCASFNGTTPSPFTNIADPDNLVEKHEQTFHGLDSLPSRKRFKPGVGRADRQHATEETYNEQGYLTEQQKKKVSMAVEDNLECRLDPMIPDSVRKPSLADMIEKCLRTIDLEIIMNFPQRSNGSVRCAAFSEKKGRQCYKYVRDGSIYCCKHEPSHSADIRGRKPSFQISPTICGKNSIICNGMSRHGRRCTHKAKDGSSFCRKHFFQDVSCPHSTHAVQLSIKEIWSKNSLTISPETHGIDSYICNGITKYGRRCTHKVRDGSSFCLKHLFQDATGPSEVADVGNSVLENTLSSSSLCKMKSKLDIQESQILNPEKIGHTSNLKKKHYEDSIVKPGYHDVGCQGSFGNRKAFDKVSHQTSSTRCIGWCRGSRGQCSHRAKPGLLHCEKHLPGSIDGSKAHENYVLKELFQVEAARNSCSGKDLPHAKSLLNAYMKACLLERTCRDSQCSQQKARDWILLEVSKNIKQAIALYNLITAEKDSLEKILGDENMECINSSIVPYEQRVTEFARPSITKICELEMDQPSVGAKVSEPGSTPCNGYIGRFRCKLCMQEFIELALLCQHWQVHHKTEAQSLFQGYSCQQCNTPFTNREEIERHWIVNHSGAPFNSDSLLAAFCTICNGQFMDFEKLWEHVTSMHPNYLGIIPMAAELTLNGESGGTACKKSSLRLESANQTGKEKGCDESLYEEPRSGILVGREKSCIQKLDVRRANYCLHATVETKNLQQHQLDCHVQEIEGYKGPKFPGCPIDQDILAIARSTCCKNKLLSILNRKYAFLPEWLSAKAAKLCSEANVRIHWHCDGYICPNGCKEFIATASVRPVVPPSVFPTASFVPLQLTFPCNGEVAYHKEGSQDGKIGVDENHLVLKGPLNSADSSKFVILCEDISFGQETVPIPCVIDKNFLEQCHCSVCLDNSGNHCDSLRPWSNFSYVTKRLLDPSLGLDTKSSQLGCICQEPRCLQEKCDHVYLFDNDNTDARDILGQLMCGRFPYDSQGRIILEEGYLVYECNSMCICQKDCQNRVLQNGVCVKLEVYKTRHKGWAVRAAQTIARGTFICEYIGEVLNDEEANKRGERYDREGCSYLYDIDVHINAEFVGRTKPFVVDATRFGNVSRFINHSCSPNLVNYQVLIESMDYQLAHIGLYASCDIDIGEELAYDYRYKLLPGKGCPCCCGAKNCRGRLY